MKVLILDLDGTLYDNAHRNHAAPRGALAKVAVNWEPWHSLCQGDTLVPEVAELVRGLAASGWLIYVITRRSANQRHATEAKMLRDRVPFHAAEFSGMYDDRPAEVIKAGIVRTLRHHAALLGAELVLMAIDDTKAVIDALEAENVKTLTVKRPQKQVANHA